jgi:uncharacterized protein (DUF2147 family)
MRRFELVLVSMAAIAGLVCGPAQGAGDTPGNLGVWRNPKDSVHVEIKGCGASICGYVEWADATAQADARKGGSENLVGMQLLRDFSPDKSGNWRGKVFVPDLNMTFSGTAEFIDATTLRAKGCLVGKFLCKSQVWKRIDEGAG